MIGLSLGLRCESTACPFVAGQLAVSTGPYSAGQGSYSRPALLHWARGLCDRSALTGQASPQGRGAGLLDGLPLRRAACS